MVQNFSWQTDDTVGFILDICDKICILPLLLKSLFSLSTFRFLEDDDDDVITE